MKKISLTAGILILFFLLPLISFSQSQGSEKTIGPVTISQSVFSVDYPQESLLLTLTAQPSDETHDIYIYVNEIPWLDGEGSHEINGGETKEVMITLYWQYIMPGEPRQNYIKIRVYPDGQPLNEIIDEQALSVTGIKPGTLDQKNLTIIRDGIPSMEVYLQQVSPETGNSLLTRGNNDLYYDTGSVVQISAARPVPTPCGTGCAQPIFNGFTGDVELVSALVCRVTMDADKEVTIVYGYTEEEEPTPSTTSPSPIPPDPPLMGDVNGDEIVDIVDALIIAQYYVNLPVMIRLNMADVNCSGSVDIIDALLIAQFYVGLITEFC